MVLEGGTMIFALAGLAVLLFAAADFLLTTTGITDRKLPSRWVAAVVWKGLARILPSAGWSRTAIGPLVMTSIAVFWIVMVALGWLLVFQAATEAVVLTEGKQPAGPALDLAYVGKALSTLGGGIVQPGGPLWALISVVVGVNGMVVLTLSVSFVLNTTQSVTLGRAFLAAAEAQAELGQDRSGMLDTLAKLTANLHSQPHALYFSTADAQRRLPEGLLRFARAWHAEKGNLTGLRVILSGLPNFDAGDCRSDDDYLDALAVWSQGYIWKEKGARRGMG
ncbi:hypothetical protein [Cribrihabitans neustonicus]|uniref:hypothetical protein n=1 Tax=Cribrihabitans neustonicus TaxID=1429085 RepID=UPI003B5CAF3D